MKSLLILFGTRPEFLKLLPVIQEAKQHFNVTTCHTSQHTETLTELFEHFNFSPDITLPQPKKNRTLNTLSSSTLQSLDSITNHPDMVIVQGDTTSAAMGALWAFNNKIPIAHVEAGLRSYNLQSPFPEEGNRKIISALSTLHFCPTEHDATALNKEGITTNIHVVGNTIIDTLLSIKHPSPNTSPTPSLLVTCHRRENFGKPFENICSALIKICKSIPDLSINFISHPNPNIATTASKLLDHPNINILPPQNYVEMIELMSNSTLILTDSGGLQEEAPSLNKPVIVLRDTTERQLGIDNENAILAGTSTNRIVDITTTLLSDPDLYSKMAQQPNPYGDGHSSKKIISILNDVLN